jgi:hypothetical protein
MRSSYCIAVTSSFANLEFTENLQLLQAFMYQNYVGVASILYIYIVDIDETYRPSLDHTELFPP